MTKGVESIPTSGVELVVFINASEKEKEPLAVLLSLLKIGLPTRLLGNERICWRLCSATGGSGSISCKSFPSELDFDGALDRGILLLQNGRMGRACESMDKFVCVDGAFERLGFWSVVL